MKTLRLVHCVALLAMLGILVPLASAGKGNGKGNGGGGGGNGGGEDPGGTPSVTYELQYVGFLPGSSWSFLNAVNNHGDAVGQGGPGTSGEWADYGRAILWQSDSETLVAINELIDPASGWHFVLATDINDAGQIVGWGSRDTNGDGQWNQSGALLFEPDQDGDGYGTIVDLSGPTNNNTRATGINEDGDVVGWFNDGTDGFHGFVWTVEDDFVDLGTEYWRLVDVGDRASDGSVLLLANQWPTPRAAFLAVFQPGLSSGTTLVWDDLGYAYSDKRTTGSAQLGGVAGVDRIVGWTSAARDASWAAAYDVLTGWDVLGTLGDAGGNNSWNDSEAKGVNLYGRVVGQSFDGTSEWRAFIYDPSYGMWDLTSLVSNASSGTDLGTPTDINDDDVICGPEVGNYAGVDGTQAYLLVPSTTSSGS